MDVEILETDELRDSGLGVENELEEPEPAFDELEDLQVDELIEGTADEGTWAAEDDLALVQEAADYQVIGRDTRKRIRNTRVVPFRYVCKLSVGCTGTLIAPNKVLTAAHCVYSRKTGRPYRNIRVIPGKNGPGTSTRAEPFGSALAVQLHFPRLYATARTYTEAWPHDYAVITLDRSLGNRIGWWRRVRALPPERLRALRLNTAGYPADRGGQHLYRAFNRVVSVNGPRIEYLHDTAGGQSGSPVWVRFRDRRTIVAIHVARDDAGNPNATPIIANRGVALTPGILGTIRGWVR